MRYMDEYKHLNKGDKFCVELDIEELAAKIIVMNYGMHRLLSALARQRLAQRPRDELASGIRALLEKGLY